MVHIKFYKKRRKNFSHKGVRFRAKELVSFVLVFASMYSLCEIGRKI
jgi:hypothetical protein